MRPPDDVLRAFLRPVDGTPPAPVRLHGGAGTSWRAGDGAGAVVLKPVPDAAEAEEVSWLAEHLPRSAEVAGLRLADAVAAQDGRWVVGGWRATRWVAGRAGPAGRWREVLAAAAAFGAAVAGLPRPALLDRRDHPWARADRVAWGEAPAPAASPAAAPLAARLRQLADRGGSHGGAQLVHGDVAGNTLLAPGLPPAVVDVSPYWRPAAWSGAVVVADALVHHGEGAGLLAVAGPAGDPSLVARALLFRLLVDDERWRAGGPAAAADGVAGHARAAAVLAERS